MNAVRRIAPALALCLGLFGLAPALLAQSLAESLAGTWYGEGYEPAWGEQTEFIFHRWPDGRFDIEFRTYKGCAVTRDQREAGSWGVADANTITVTTNSIDGREAGPWDDDYRILEATKDRYRYLHLQTGVEYETRRVDANFSFPACGPIS